MAKLSARGRTTLQGVKKHYTSDDGIPYTHYRRLMSDGTILNKIVTKAWNSGWTVVSKANLDRLPDGGAEWLKAKLEKGWEKE